MHQSAHSVVNLSELVLPARVIEKLTVVEAVVVDAVRLGVIAGRQHRRLVPIDRVLAEEVLDFGGDRLSRQRLSRLLVNAGVPLLE